MSARHRLRVDNRGDADLDDLRVPPQATEAEQAVLGGIMLIGQYPNRAYDAVMDLLDESSFYRRDHQLIWAAMKQLADQKRPIDAVTVADWFEAQGIAEQVAGGSYLMELASTTPSAANVRAYAEIVMDKSRLRRLIDVGTQMIHDAFNPTGRDSLDLIGTAQTQVAALLKDQPCELESVAPVMMRVHERLLERYQRGGGIDGLTTGIDELDVALNGLKPGVYVIAGRPKMGKTTLAQNIAEHVALVKGKAVAVFSMEMQAEALGDRMLSSLGDVDANRVRSGELDDIDWANISDAMRRLRGARIYISRPRGARVEHIVAQARRQHARDPLGLIVVDYLQLIHAPGDNRSTAIGDVSRALTLMAHELGVPVILLSQLNRDLERRDNKRPIPADLRDSGAIEQDADAVVFIYRDEVYNEKSRYAGTAELIIALQRNGAAGMVRVRYRPDRFRFENLPMDWEPAPLPEGDDKPKRGGFKKMQKGDPKSAAAGSDE